MIKGLRDLFDPRIPPKVFVTIRLGPKWADKLHLEQGIKISISDDPSKPKVIGYARVLSISKKLMTNITNQELRKNIGAKNILQIYNDMAAVYKKKKVSLFSVVSVIELEPEIFSP